MKTWITALLTASALLPVAAHAQRFGADARIEANGDERPDRADRPDRGDHSNRADRGERADRGDRPQFRQRADAGASMGMPPQQIGPDRQQFGQDRRDDRGRFDAQRRDGRPDPRTDGPDRQQFRGDRDNRADARADRRDDDRPFRGNRDDAARGRPGWQNYSAFGDNRGRPNQGYGRPAYDGRGNDYRPGYDNRSGAWNRDWRSNNRYDWNRYRTVNRGAYRLPRYYAPSNWGYGYRRFTIGVTLSAGLWGQNYWIDDPYAYRLPEAYGPYRWVRYYDDALLIDIRTGRVVDTVYDIFY